MFLRLFVTLEVTKDVHSVHYFHAVVLNLHNNRARHEEGKAALNNIKFPYHSACLLFALILTYILEQFLGQVFCDFNHPSVL